MHQAGRELAVLASDLLQTLAFDSSFTEIGFLHVIEVNEILVCG
jgi:hypothetical protein